MPPLSEKSRWNASPARVPGAVTRAKRKLSGRDLIAIAAGAVAIAGLGVAAWQASGDHDGVSLSTGAPATSGDLTGADGWDGLNAQRSSGGVGASAGLVAETPEQFAAQTRHFQAALTPRIKDGGIAGFVVGTGPTPAVFARAGLKPGDMIVFVNGRGMQSPEMVADLSQEIAGSRTAEFVVERDGAMQTLTAKVQD